MAAITKDGFLKFIVESIGEEEVLFETYASNNGASIQQRRNLIDDLRQAGIELQHGPDPEVPKVADAIAARQAREDREATDRNLRADQVVVRGADQNVVRNKGLNRETRVYDNREVDGLPVDHTDTVRTDGTLSPAKVDEPRTVVTVPAKTTTVVTTEKK